MTPPCLGPEIEKYEELSLQSSVIPNGFYQGIKFGLYPDPLMNTL
jgi:hypothetical protein